LQTCAVIVEQVKYVSTGRVNIQLLQDLFEIPRIIQPGAMLDSAEEGDTVSIGDIWGDTVGLYYVDPSPAQKTQTYGLAFRSRAIQTRRWREDDTELDVFEVSVKEDNKVIDKSCGYLLTNVLT